jgi:hypothetical protein
MAIPREGDTGMSCKPYDNTTHKGGFCFGSALCKLLGVKYDDSCLKCFTVAGYTVDNNARPDQPVSRDGTA